MDHDIMWSNDFEGEAFIELSQVPGVKSELGDSLADLVPIELYLTHPKGILFIFKYIVTIISLNILFSRQYMSNIRSLRIQGDR